VPRDDEGPKKSPILDRGLAYLTIQRAITILIFEKKRAFILPIPCLKEYEMRKKQKKKKYVAPSLVQLGSFKKKTKASGNKLKEAVFSNRFNNNLPWD
jgi:Family of unknown function (DUF5972)